MKFLKCSLVPLCLLVAGLTLSPARAAFAQKAGQVQPPPKYLYVTSVELKPEVSDAYAKIEQEEVAALRAANAPSHYLAMWDITGTPSVTYLYGFDSFAQMQKDHEATMAMTQLQDTLKADNAQEASMIVGSHSGIYMYDKDLSLNPDVDLSKMHFMRVLIFHVRSGHEQDFERVVKLFAKAYQSSIPEARWAMWEEMYGKGSGNTYVLTTPMDSLSYVDSIVASDKKFDAAVGQDQLQLLEKAADADVESSESELSAFGDKISYMP